MNNRSIRIAFIAATIATLISGANAHAVEQTGSFHNQFATCVVNYKASQARLFVIGQKSAPRERRCLGREWSQVTFRPQTYRYALAKVLLQHDYAEGLPSKIGEVSPQPILAAKGLRRADADAEKRLLLVADCVVRKEPTKSFALVGVETGEVSAEPVMALLAASIIECAGDAQVRYPTGFEMHEAIVTRMYQLAFAAGEPAHA